MKSNHFKIAVLSVVSMLFFACSNDFLYEKSPLADETTTILNSNIVVSPTWDAEDYPIYEQSAGNRNFTITEAPEWLILASKSGKFSDGTALINCSARKMKEFSKIGVYHAIMTIEDEQGKKYMVQVAYVNEGNPRIETSEKLILNSSNNSQIQISNNGEGILIWRVVQCPEWLNLKMQPLTAEQYLSGVLMQNDVAQLYGSIDIDKFSEDLDGQIIIVSNDKTNPQKVINISIDMGNPRISTNNSTLDFDKTTTSLSLYLFNQSSGVLMWQFTDLPEWLACSETSGINFDYQSKTVTFTVDRNRVPEGISVITIYLNSNDASNPRIPITVKIRNMTANPANVKGIDGSVTDVWLDKSNGKLYYTTTGPNKFVEFDIVSKTVTRSLDLTGVPNCFSIDESRSKAIIGHNGSISVIALKNWTNTKNIAVDISVYDIEWGANDWIAYTESGMNNVQWTKMYWVNIDTESKQTTDQSVYENCIIKKVPGQNYIIASEKSLSSGVYVYDISAKTRKSNIHLSMENIWFIKNGEFILACNSGKIYRTSSILAANGYTSNLTEISRLKSNNSYYYKLTWADYCSAAQGTWVLHNEDPYDNSPNKLLFYEDSDYSPIKTLYITDFYVKDGIDYDVSGRYVFANQTGTELVVLSNATNNSAVWSMEFIPVL